MICCVILACQTNKPSASLIAWRKLFSFFLFCLLFIPTTTAQDNPSLVELSVDDHSKSVLLGDSVTFVFTLANFDEDFDQNVQMEVLFVGGEGPDYQLSDDYVDVPADFTSTTNLTIDCSNEEKRSFRTDCTAAFIAFSTALESLLPCPT